MGRNFKIRFSKVIQTFQSCRPKDPSNLPTHPVTSSHNPSSMKRHVLSPKSSPHYSYCTLSPPETPRHKIYNSSASEYDVFTSSESWLLFNEDQREDRESDGLICSSRSSLETIREVSISRCGYKKKKRLVRRERRNVMLMCRSSVSSDEGETPARLSVFMKLMHFAVQGKVKESFAVIKKSDDPYEDFKRSMVEMILSKQMFEDRELEQLLQCFLSLNSRHYHGLIVQAFTEIWEAMFCRYTTHQ